MLLLSIYNHQSEMKIWSVPSDLYYTKGLSPEPVPKCLKQNPTLHPAIVFTLEFFWR